MAASQKLCCEVRRIVDHGDHVYTIELASDKLFPIFKPGQFLHLALDSYDPSEYWPDSRVFSIASPPNKRDCLSITYSVRGRFTARMEKELTEEKKVWIKMPYGEFIVHATNDVVLIAGGTGITAFTAFIAGLSESSLNNIFVAYGARTPDLLIYRNLIDHYANGVRRLKRWYFIEEGSIDPFLVGQEIRGKLSLKEIWEQIYDPFSSMYYLSGPPGMIKTLSCDLIDRDVNKDLIRIDAWE